MESNIRAPGLLNLLSLLQKSDKMLGKPHLLSHFTLSLQVSFADNLCKQF